MAKFNAVFSSQEPLKASFESSNPLNAMFGSVLSIDTSRVLVNSTQGWNSDPSIIALKGVVYVYADYRDKGDGRYAPAFKVGDGLAYLIDLPFNYGADGMEISAEQIAFWNNKVRAFLSEDDPENLILTKY